MDIILKNKVKLSKLKQPKRPRIEVELNTIVEDRSSREESSRMVSLRNNKSKAINQQPEPPTKAQVFNQEL